MHASICPLPHLYSQPPIYPIIRPSVHLYTHPASQPVISLSTYLSSGKSLCLLVLSQSVCSSFNTFELFNQLVCFFLQFCVTYCIGNLSDPTMHDVCYDIINAGNLYSNTSASLLSQYIYEKNISFHIPVAYGLLQLEMTPGNKVCHHP